MSHTGPVAVASKPARTTETPGGDLRPSTEPRDTVLALCSLTALAAILRLPTLGLQSYDFDEGATVYILRGSFNDLLDGVARHESTPPLYYVLAWLWAQAFGTGEIALRLLSAIAGVGIVPIVYAVGATLASRRIGLAAAAFVAVSPYLVFYSQEARSYALLVLLSGAGLLFCVRAIAAPSARTLGLWAAVSVAALATHYFAVFPWLGEAVALAVFGAPRRLLVRAIAVVALASIPLLVLARHQAAAGHASWIGASSLLERVRVTLETFALGATFKGTLPHAILAACGVVAVAMSAAFVTAGVLLARRATAAERRAAGVAGLIAAVAIVLPLVAALGPGDYFIHKNLITVVPVLAVVVAAGLACARAGRIGTIAAIGLVLAGTALTLMSFAIPSMRRADLRRVSQQLGRPARERVVVFVPRWRILLEHYQGALEDLPESGRLVTEVDVFTAGTRLPAGTVPRGFRLARVRRGDTFTLFSYRSPAPIRVTAANVAPRTFEESGLRPVAVVQRAAPRG